MTARKNYEFDFKEAARIARAGTRAAHRAEMQGATPRGIGYAINERNKSVKHALMAEVARVTKEARDDMERIQAELDAPPSGDPTARLVEQNRIANMASVATTQKLIETVRQAMSSPLEADTDALAAYGAELRRRGGRDKDARTLADVVGRHLEHPKSHYSDEYNHAQSVVKNTQKWFENADTSDDFPVPDSLHTFSQYIEVEEMRAHEQGIESTADERSLIPTPRVFVNPSAGLPAPPPEFA